MITEPEPFGVIAMLVYPYFAEWYLEEQIEFCEMNNYLFNKYGELIRHLEEVTQ